MSVYGKDAQLRRGLATGLNFYTAQQLAKRAAEQQAQDALAKKSAAAASNLSEQRFKTALELAKQGNLSAQGGLQNFVRTGSEDALGNIGQFDQAGAQNLMLAEKFSLPLAKEEQFAPANELLGRLGIKAQVGTTPTQTARIGELDAMRSLRETQAKADEAVSQARITHLKALTNAANKRAEQISKEIVKAGNSGKLTLDNVKSYNELLKNYQDILQGQLQTIGQMPDVMLKDENGIETGINPKYANDLTNLLTAFKSLQQQSEVLTAFQAENTLPPVPYRNAYLPPSAPKAQDSLQDFRNQLLQSIMPQLAAPQTTSAPATTPSPAQPSGEVIETDDGRRWQINVEGNYEEIP